MLGEECQRCRSLFIEASGESSGGKQQGTATRLDRLQEAAKSCIAHRDADVDGAGFKDVYPQRASEGPREQGFRLCPCLGHCQRKADLRVASTVCDLCCWRGLGLGAGVQPGPHAARSEATVLTGPRQLPLGDARRGRGGGRTRWVPTNGAPGVNSQT